MAIAFDASIDGGSASATSLTFAHTTSGSDRILFVYAFHNTTTDRITGATYAGAAMTLVDKVSNASGVGFSYLFYLIAPATGANNVVISANASVFIAGMASSYTGAKQSAQPDAFVTYNTPASSAATVTLTSIANNSWTVIGIGCNTASPGAGAGTTSRHSNANGLALMDSNAAITPANRSV